MRRAALIAFVLTLLMVAVALMACFLGTDPTEEGSGESGARRAAEESVVAGAPGAQPKPASADAESSKRSGTSSSVSIRGRVIGPDGAPAAAARARVAERFERELSDSEDSWRARTRSLEC